MSDLGNKEIFAKNLKYYMNKYNLDNTTMAKNLKVPYNTFLEWVNGGAYPRIDKIEMLANYFNILKSDLIEEKQKNKIPVLGRIPAGIPIEAIEEILDYEEIPKEWLTGDKIFFALKINGDSMYPFYNDGDIVIFEKTSNCESGQHCAVMVNGNDGTFKKVLKNEAGITLQPLNPNYEPVFYSNKQIEELPVTIVGVAKEIRRKLNF